MITIERLKKDMESNGLHIICSPSNEIFLTALLSIINRYLSTSSQRSL